MPINCDSKCEVSIVMGIIIGTVIGTVRKCHGFMLPTPSQYQAFRVLVRLHLGRMYYPGFMGSKCQREVSGKWVPKIEHTRIIIIFMTCCKDNCYNATQYKVD